MYRLKLKLLICVILEISFGFCGQEMTYDVMDIHSSEWKVKSRFFAILHKSELAQATLQNDFVWYNKNVQSMRRQSFFFNNDYKPIKALYSSIDNDVSFQAQINFAPIPTIETCHSIVGCQTETWKLKSFFSELMLFQLIPELSRLKIEKKSIQLLLENNLLSGKVESQFAKIVRTSKVLKLKAMKEIKCRAWEVTMESGAQATFWVSEDGTERVIRAVLMNGSQWVMSAEEISAKY